MEISVVIPVYNAPPIFNECLLALSNSSLLPSELIIVDDCSDIKIIKPSLAFPTRVIRSETPLGAGVARNMGATQAKGDILLFIDSDVIITSDTISLIMNRFKADKILSAVSGFYDYRNRFDNQASIYNNLYFEYKQSHIKPDSPYADTAIWAVKKEVFVKSGGFATGLYSAEDLELAVKLDSMGYKLATDKDIRVTHVKYLSFKGWLKNRFTASTNMLLARLKRPAYDDKSRDKNNENRFFGTILPAQIISPFLVWGVVLDGIIYSITHNTAHGIIFLVLLGFYLFVNRDYIQFIAKRRGLEGILLAPYMLLEHSITLISVTVAIVKFIFKRPYNLYRGFK